MLQLSRRRGGRRREIVLPDSTYVLTCSQQLDERLRREGGAKTHKQRVEELNKYLSTLSEHHDMPRIGPG
jgi:hypothetical protein